MIDLSLIQKHKTPTWSYLFHFNAITTYSNLIDMLYLRAIKRFRLHSLHGSSQLIKNNQSCSSSLGSMWPPPLLIGVSEKLSNDPSSSGKASEKPS